MVDDSVAAVHTLGRRQLALQHHKLTQHVVDFAALPALPAVQEVYLALGTTINAAGSQAAFRAVDFDANLAVARAARAQGATKLGVVSSLGADPRSSVFYNRIKGELEQALAQLGFSTLVFARPSLLAGDRTSLGQPVRVAEKMALAASAVLDALIPDKYRPVQASAVALALLRNVREGEGSLSLSSSAIRDMHAA